MFDSRKLALRRAILWIFLASTTVTPAMAGKQAKEPKLPQTEVGKAVDIDCDETTGICSTELAVLTYNVAALPWPFLKRRAGPIKAIGEELQAMRVAGNAPDIVLIQEGFRSSTRLLVEASGYPNWVRGPMKSDESDETKSHVPKNFKKKRNLLKGELFGRLMNSGLYILSEYPILSKTIEPFYRGECAGFDCGANKGILWVEIAVPGVPGEVQFLTTHLNSRGASGTSEERTLKAHNLQFLHITKFLDHMWDARHPFIFGGDLNIKNAPDRVEFMESQSFELESYPGAPEREVDLATGYCLSHPACSYNIPLDDDKLGLEKQDWQGFDSGSVVEVEPTSVERMFHEPNSYGYSIRGRQTLSDHDGLLVRYKLSWKAEAAKSPN